MPDLPFGRQPQGEGAVDEAAVIDRVQPLEHPVVMEERPGWRMVWIRAALLKASAVLNQRQSTGFVAGRVVTCVSAL